MKSAFYFIIIKAAETTPLPFETLCFDWLLTLIITCIFVIISKKTLLYSKSRQLLCCRAARRTNINPFGEDEEGLLNEFCHGGSQMRSNLTSAPVGLLRSDSLESLRYVLQPPASFPQLP